MAPGTHAFISWWTANVIPLSRRDRLLVFLAGLLPDLDGLTLLYSEEAYLRYHHVLSHNLLGCLLWTGLAAALARQRAVCAALTCLCWHLHLACDYFGSGGGNRDIWVLPYLYPLVGELTEHRFIGPSWYWNRWQWELNAWPNLLVGVLAAIGWLYIAVRLNRTWFEFLWPRLDLEICRVLRKYLGGQPVEQWSPREGKLIRRSFLIVSTLALFACVVAGAQSSG
jgi:inner membrane protein